MDASQAQALLLLNIVMGSLIPLVQQVLTKTGAGEHVKVLVMAFLVAVIGFFTPFASGEQSFGDLDWALAALSITVVFVQTIATHYGLWKPLGLTGDSGLIAQKLPQGIGKVQ